MKDSTERLPVCAVVVLTWKKMPGFPKRTDPLLLVTEIYFFYQTQLSKHMYLPRFSFEDGNNAGCRIVG